MKNNKLLKDFSRYVILSVFGTLGVSCYILVDTYFISKGLGANGLTALNLAIPIFNFIYGTGLMLGIGGATQFTVLKSQGKNEEANSVYTITFITAAIFSLIFAIIGLMFSGRLATILGADDNVVGMSDTYVKWLMIFAPGFIFNTLHLCFVRNDNAPRLATLSMIIGSFSNIILDYIFIFIFDWGMFGAVFATGLSSVISIVVISLHFIKHQNSFNLIGNKLRLNMIIRTLSLGFPSLISQISSATVIIVFNFLILGLEGNIGVAAYGVVANISIVVIAVLEGVAQGAQPLISRCYGEGNHKSVRSVFKYSLITVILVSAAFYLLIFIFAKPVTGIFNSENNSVLYDIAVVGLKLYFISGAFAGFNIVSSIFFTSVEKPLPAQVLSILRGLIVIIPIAFALSSIWKMTGVWLAFPVTECLVASLGAVIYFKCKNNLLKG